MARRVTRRGFIRDVGIGAAALAVGPGVVDALGQGRQTAGKTLKLLQWSHFVPSYDTWFNEYCKQWGAKNNVDVVVDHISLSDLKSTFAAEVVAGKGHDLVEFIAPPSDFEPSVLDLTDVNNEARKRFGAQLPVATRSSYNPHTKKFYGFCHGWTIDPGDYRKSLWAKVGKAGGPRTWEDVLTYGAQIMKQTGVEVGIGISQELDSNMAGRALLWSFDASIQDEHENVVLDSKQTIEAIKYMTDLYKRALTPEVFGWNPASNNQLLIAGRASYILNSISAYRSAQKDVPDVAKDVFFTPALKGPTGTGWASEHVIYVSVVPKFAENPDLAKQFLVDLCANYDEAMWASKLYNSPAFFHTKVAGGKRTYPAVASAPTLNDLFHTWFDHDPFALPGEPTGKLKVLEDAQRWSTNIGHPGAASPAIGEIFGTFVIPNMFATVAQGKQTPEQAAAQAAGECRAIFKKWREQGLVGGKA
jgi:multiple sugar transport system substrate-binding protein